MILGGQRLVLKRDLDRRRAERYRDVLVQSGLVVALESQDPPQGLEVEPPPSIDVSQNFSQTSEGAAASRELPATEAVEEMARPRSGAGPRPGARAPDPSRCPKCGSNGVSPVTGVCQACGVVVERYLARLAAQGDGRTVDNPYAPTRVDLTPPSVGGNGTSDDLLPEPLRVPAGYAWRWIAEGFGAFRAAPATWVLAAIVFAVISALANAAESIFNASGSSAGAALGSLLSLASVVLGPMVAGGIMIGLDSRRRGRAFGAGYVFQGFSTHPGRLALLGLAYIGLSILTVLAIVAVVLAGSGLGALGAGASDARGLLAAGQAILGNPLTWIGIGVGFLAFLAIWMMSAFAPALVTLNERGPIQALAQSFAGCLRNLLAGLVFWISLLAIAVAVGIGLTLLGMLAAFVAQLGAIMAVLVIVAFVAGALVLSAVALAVVLGSHYAAYRDIFYRRGLT